MTTSNFLRLKHKFEAPAGHRLCTYCGHLETNENKHLTSAPNGFMPIETHPHNAQDVEVITASGKIIVAHHAQDLSGEEQPPFKGWFIKMKASSDGKTWMKEIDEPTGWRPIKQ